MYGRPLDEIDWNRVAPDAIAIFGDTESDGVAATPDRTPRWRPSGFIEWFALGLTLMPALLFIPGSQAYRLPIRTGAYAISLFALALWWFHRGGERRAKHPAGAWIGVTLLWVGLMILHPLTGSLLIGVAQFSLYVSILCPVFWAQSFVVSRQKLMRTLVVLLLCNGINSAVGVMQVYDPDRWMPRELSSVYQGAGGKMALAASTYVGANGRLTLRPPGLFDAPGAVAGAGMVATILGLVFCLEPIGLSSRGISLAFAMAGMLALYLSHVRAAFVMTLAMMAAYLAMLAVQEQKKRALGFGVLGFGIVVVGLSASDDAGRPKYLQAVSDAARRRSARLVLSEPGDTGGSGDDGSGCRISVGGRSRTLGHVELLLRRHRWSNARIVCRSPAARVGAGWRRSARRAVRPGAARHTPGRSCS